MCNIIQLWCHLTCDKNLFVLISYQEHRYALVQAKGIDGQNYCVLVPFLKRIAPLIKGKRAQLLKLVILY